MTPAERAVIDAARAYVAYYWGPDAPTSAAGAALYAAVRALPRPLSEQLADLRVGAVVEHLEGYSLSVAGNFPTYQYLAVVDANVLSLVHYYDLARIISSPEADRG